MPSSLHRDEAQLRADALREQLPGHEVAVVLHLGEQNHVAGVEKFPPQAWATRLMPSVVPRVKIISSALARADECRGPRCARLLEGSVARLLNSWMPR